MAKKLFITGTGTDVGKTYVSALILKKLRENNINAAYFKAAMSGNRRDENGLLIPGDALEVKTVSGIDQPLDEMCPYVYETAVSPHLASKLEGGPVELSKAVNELDRLSAKYDYITAEGSGGILCPLRFDSERVMLEDFIKACHFPCLMVADAGLGTINSVVLTAGYMKSRGITIRGIIFNHYKPGNRLHEDNLYMCEQLTGLKVISCVKDGDTDLDIPVKILELLYK